MEGYDGKFYIIDFDLSFQKHSENDQRMCQGGTKGYKSASRIIYKTYVNPEIEDIYAMGISILVLETNYKVKLSIGN